MRRSPAVLPPLVAVLALAAPTAAQEPVSVLAPAGQPVLALAAHPAVKGVLRQASGGRQRIVAERLRLPGPPLGVTADRFVYGWGCDPRGCEGEGLFLAFDIMRERIYLLVVENGAPTLFVPPRTAPWPGALAEPVHVFHPALAAALRFAPAER